MITPTKMPDRSLLFELFDIDENWNLIHKKRRFGVTVGKIAGGKTPQGYTRLKIGKHCYLKHRLMFFMINGVDPLANEVDHVDGNKLNDNPSNLRLATHGQNQQNGSCYKNNKTGYRGVHWHKQHRKYAVVVQGDKKRVHIGLYLNKIDAAKAYNEAAKLMFGEFARLNEV